MLSLVAGVTQQLQYLYVPPGLGIQTGKKIDGVLERSLDQIVAALRDGGGGLLFGGIDRLQMQRLVQSGAHFRIAWILFGQLL